MILAVQDFFHSGVVALGLNSIFIVLLLKIRDSITVDQFRPIVLGNFLFKISSKILANSAEDFLSRLFSRMVVSDQLLPISSPRGFSAPAHLLYADDVLVFCRGTVKNLKSVMLAFRVYGSISSQLVNWSKALSLAGRATLIRSVITGSFVHSFMVYKWPVFLTKMVTKKIKSFLWTGSCEECKLVRVAWNRFCRPYALGVLGLKDLALLNDSLLRKFTWKLITSNNFAFTFLHKRDGIVSCKTAYSRMFQDIPQVPLWRDVWSCYIPTSRSILTWRLLLDRHPTDDHLCRAALSLVWHSVYDVNRSGIGCMRNCVDDLLILHRFGLYGRLGKAPVIRSVVWSLLAPRWIKVNTDGAALGSPGMGGYGGVFQTCRSFVKACFAVPLGQVFAFEAELLATSLAINYAWNLGWHRTWLESDSSYVVQLLSVRSDQVTCRVHHAWQCCLHQISHMEFQVSYIIREGNQVTYALSKHDLGISSDSWWSSTHSFCSSLVGYDCMGRESFKFS
ncbi:hypothetical protein Ddye_032141 [Dipteronia dyeriana]|uniref:RNase H type-1 domain-containing protein n=1 Tax=Dipteronia dyeriana TaxID=168575 RepID=A0AAD9WMY0_9ROSI|nr:hypothetical protein Ddye_032141 [Dipteronia dyeriana]